MTHPETERSFAQFRRRTLFAVSLALGLGVLLLAAWATRTLLLMSFLAVILAVVLRELGAFVGRGIGIGTRYGVLAVAATLVGALVGGGVLIAPTLVAQATQLVQRVPQAAANLHGRLGDYPWLEALWSQVSSGLSLPEPTEAMGQAGRVLGGISASLGYAGLAFVGALFLALEPDLYRRGLVQLVPVRHRAFADQLLHDLERTIVSWLGAQLILMVFIGLMVGLGLWAVGVPYPLALGLLAGLLEFIPYIGPILSATPAILIAFTAGPTMAAWTLGVFVVVQQVENNVLQPLIQQSRVDIPPVLLLVSLFGMGALFGVPGLLVATPLLAVVLVLVRRIYVEHILEGRDFDGQQPTAGGMAARDAAR